MDIYKYLMAVCNFCGIMDNDTTDRIADGNQQIKDYHMFDGKTTDIVPPAISILSYDADKGILTIADKGHFCADCDCNQHALYAHTGFASIGFVSLQDYLQFDYGMDAYPGNYTCPCGKKFSA